MSKEEIGVAGASAWKREIVCVDLPVLIANALYRVAQNGSGRDELTNTLWVEKAVPEPGGKETTLFVTTDTHTLLIAAAPSTVEMEGGLYSYETKPVVKGKMANLWLTPSSLVFPNYRRVIPKKEERTPIGICSTAAKDSLRLEVRENLCIDLKKIASLLPAEYTVEIAGSPTYFKYVFDGAFGDWKICYIVMGMNRTVTREARKEAAA